MRRRQNYAFLKPDRYEADEKGFPGHRLTRLVVEALELIAFFIDAIIFIQDDIFISTGYHHPDDIVI